MADGNNGAERALGGAVWGRKAARLPADGVLLVATDLQGNLRDYERMKQIYWEEDRAGNNPILAFCGDLVHGPSPDLNEPGAWPEYLGDEYADQSADIVRDFEQFSRYARAFSLMGNHEHAHVGGPVVAKFYDDEAMVLDEALKDDAERIQSFFLEFPLIAVSPSGVVLTHGAPRATEPDLEAFETLHYNGHQGTPSWGMVMETTVGSLLWSRSASTQHAQELLQAVGLSSGFVAFGHDIVATGHEVVDQHQICVSTSFGLHGRNKTYLRLDLSKRYEGTHALHRGQEICSLYEQWRPHGAEKEPQPTPA